MTQGQQLCKKNRISPTGNRTPASCELSEDDKQKYWPLYYRRYPTYRWEEMWSMEKFAPVPVIYWAISSYPAVSLSLTRPTTAHSNVEAQFPNEELRNASKRLSNVMFVHRSTPKSNCKNGKRWDFDKNVLSPNNLFYKSPSLRDHYTIDQSHSLVALSSSNVSKAFGFQSAATRCSTHHLDLCTLLKMLLSLNRAMLS